MKRIRNFSIIAHINHGKSTLSDRIIQICAGLSNHEMEDQILDSMELERERGITIKAQSVTLDYKAINGEIYQLNFIDTPGHVDFSYEVSRSLAACEGALLLIDASQGVEAQTVTNCSIAVEMNLKVIPVLNKIDLSTANPERIITEIRNIIGIDATNAVRCSAKTGFGVIDLLERLVQDIPAPEGNPDTSLQALIIDSWFDQYLGVISLVRIKNGTMHKGDKIKVMSTGQVYNIDRLGVFTPKQVDHTSLRCGAVGWIVCAIKDVFGAPVGDTLTGAYNPAEKKLSSFKKIKPQIYAGLFPVSSDNYENFRNALNKLSLNDASLFYEPEKSTALGFGFRCGFLGLLHMEIIQERLKREYNLDLITTEPTVTYEVQTTSEKLIYIDNPSNLPSPNKIKELREPIVECHILLPQKFLGNIIKLCVEKRGIQTDIIYQGHQVVLIYDIPMAEVIIDFSDRLKSTSRGYASLDYNFKRFQASNLVCIDVFINYKRVDALASITHNSNALSRGREIVDRIKNLIPRHQFDVTIQAAIGQNIIASAKVKQFRKNVLAKCYGGDISRKKKLIQKQKKGKKRMKQIGSVELPQVAFRSIFNIKK